MKLVGRKSVPPASHEVRIDLGLLLRIEQALSPVRIHRLFSGASCFICSGAEQSRPSCA